MTSKPKATRRLSQAAAAGSEVMVEISSRQRMLTVNIVWLERLVRRAVLAIGADAAEIGVVVVDDRRIARLHDEWMQDPEPTDVITFDLGSDPPRRLVGDIAVSAETANRLAKELGWQPRQELAYYILHGLLHLAGYDDLTPGERRRMRKAEREVLVAVGLPTPPRRRGPGSRSRHAR